NPGQTLRMNVVSVSSAARHVMFGVDMYRRSGSQTQMASCPTTHRFANRQSCEVTLATGEAASFDVAFTTETGVTQVLPAVQDDDRGSHPELIYTIEIRENDKTIFMLPAVQRTNTWAG